MLVYEKPFADALGKKKKIVVVVVGCWLAGLWLVGCLVVWFFGWLVGWLVGGCCCCCGCCCMCACDPLRVTGVPLIFDLLLLAGGCQKCTLDWRQQRRQCCICEINPGRWIDVPYLL